MYFGRLHLLMIVCMRRSAARSISPRSRSANDPMGLTGSSALGPSARCVSPTVMTMILFALPLCGTVTTSKGATDLACGGAQVYKGLRRGVQEVAVKKLARNTSEDVWFKLLTKEIDVLKKVSYDRNIVQYYGACLQDQASAMLVMEYMAVRTPLPIGFIGCPRDVPIAGRKSIVLCTISCKALAADGLMLLADVQYRAPACVAGCTSMGLNMGDSAADVRLSMH